MINFVTIYSVNFLKCYYFYTTKHMYAEIGEEVGMKDYFFVDDYECILVVNNKCVARHYLQYELGQYNKFIAGTEVRCTEEEFFHEVKNHLYKFDFQDLIDS